MYRNFSGSFNCCFCFVKEKINQHIVMHQRCEEPDITTLKNAKHVKCQHGKY